jgi:cellulose synthase/poly-beta-1,6-N-acetylglucosamine synthase-like glycosyltransferase
LIGFTIFRIMFFTAFVGLHCALMAGLVLEWRRDRKVSLGVHAADGSGPAGFQSGSLPRVSVIIPVHDESLRMDRLLESLAAQEYPAAEIIFVDDRSTDGGLQKLEGFIRRMAELGRGKCRIITLTENPGPNHKQYALGRGIEAAEGDFLLLTDADCEVPPCWIAAMVRRLADERIGAVIGPVFKTAGGTGFFWFYQCLDHAVRYIYLAGASGIGAAGGGFGNNLILRRESLIAVGGYGSVPFSPTEDAALVARIRSHSRYQVRSAVGTETLVFTGPEKTWRALLNQTLRWNNGGLFSPDLMARLSFSYLMISISMGILAIPLLPFFPGLWPLPFGVVLSMLMDTIAMRRLFGSALPGDGASTALYYLFQLVFTPAWMTLLTLFGFLGVKINWKGSPVN